MVWSPSLGRDRRVLNDERPSGGGKVGERCMLYGGAKTRRTRRGYIIQKHEHDMETRREGRRRHSRGGVIRKIRARDSGREKIKQRKARSRYATYNMHGHTMMRRVMRRYAESRTQNKILRKTSVISTPGQIRSSQVRPGRASQGGRSSLRSAKSGCGFATSAAAPLRSFFAG